MSIRLKCGHCNASLVAKPASRGKTLKCPKCKGSVSVPVEAAKATDGEKSSSDWRATNKQKAFAKSLEIQFEDNVTRGEISALIDSALEKQKLDRYQELDDINNRRNDAYVALREEAENEVDEDNPRLSIATVEQMLSELVQREEGAIIVTFEWGCHDGEDFRIRATDDLSEDDMLDTLLRIGCQIAEQRAV